MTFAISLTIVSTLFPAMMVFFGRWLYKYPPPDINNGFGYRTRRSKASKEAWNFAQVTAGRYWAVLGKYSLPIFVFVSVCISVLVHVLGIDERHYVFFFYGLIALQLMVFLSVVPYTEKQLKARF